jgi:hypothetical protein
LSHSCKKEWTLETVNRQKLDNCAIERRVGQIFAAAFICAIPKLDAP